MNNMTAQTQAEPTPKPSFTPVRTNLLHRKCACGGTPGSTGECEECRKKRLQRSPAEHIAPSAVPPLVHEVLSSAGRPLDPFTRAFMEPRFGHDFANVRIHDDARAADSVRAVGALAYTVANSVVFGAGHYAPGTAAGRRLLAHELAHVVQQEGSEGTLPAEVGSANDPVEHETERAAAAALAGGSTALPREAGPLRIRRLGANPGCTTVEADAIHQAIFDARGWLNKAIPQLEATLLTPHVLASMRRNFGPTYGVAANASLIAGRLRAARSEISTIPFGCAGVADKTCAAGPCGYATAAGAHAATICTNSTLAAGSSMVFRAGCVLHEGLHASFSNFTVDEYSGWHGRSSSTATYPGTGTDPLLNADSYTTLVMDLS